MFNADNWQRFLKHCRSITASRRKLFTLGSLERDFLSLVEIATSQCPKLSVPNVLTIGTLVSVSSADDTAQFYEPLSSMALWQLSSSDNAPDNVEQNTLCLCTVYKILHCFSRGNAPQLKYIFSLPLSGRKIPRKRNSFVKTHACCTDTNKLETGLQCTSKFRPSKIRGLIQLPHLQ